MRAAVRGELDRLRGLQMFRDLRPAELKHVAGLVQQTRLPAGWRLTKQGQAAAEAFIIVAGRAAVDVDGVVIAELGPGDTVGEMALLDAGPRSATVTALTDVSVLFLTPQALDALLSIPAVAVEVVRSMAVRLRRVEAATPHPEGNPG